MKRTLLLTGIISIVSLSSFSNKFHNEKDLTISTEVSSVEWIGEKVAGKHNGTISIKEGSLHLHNGHLTAGKVVINMETITCSDLEGEWSQKLVGHLNSPDFFDVSNHKTSLLEITSVVAKEGNIHTISGNLTIKGISKPISFPANIEWKDNKFAAYATVEVDRTLYDIKYGSGQFFDNLGDKMIKDNFIIKFKIAAK
jgi:polyisoprenoid-binding protein YceI